jgi:sugar (pentulose or hexulose) kinase
LGVDLGTQSVRVLAVDDVGTVLASGSEGLVSHRDGRRHEQDPEAWWSALTAACRSIFAEIDPSAVAGLACCATSGTICLADTAGVPLTPGVMYDDSRAVEECRIVDDAGAGLWDAYGYRPQPSWALPKLLWLLRHHAAGPDRTDVRLLHQSDVVTRRLVGHDVATDSSHALKTGYDLVNDTWPFELMDDLGLAKDVLPEVVRPGTRLGAVSDDAAGATGIPAGTPVIAGMTDGCAAQIAAGALEVGSVNSVLGTTLVLKGVAGTPVHDPLGVVYSHRSPDGAWFPGGASSVGAGVLSARFPDRDLGAMDARAAEREPATVAAYPLVSRGERFPFRAPDAEGFVTGEPQDEADLYAALLQGVAFAERLCVDDLDLLGAPTDGPVRLTGGAVRSPYWCQLRADVLARPVELPENAEAGVGMAVLAASAGGRPLAEAAKAMVRVSRTIEPRPAGPSRFREPFAALVDELERRGWLPSTLADHSRRRLAS